MFKSLLKEFIEKEGINQNELSDMVGISQQTISEFLNKEGNPHKKTRDRYFDNLNGFKDYYEKNKNRVIHEPREEYKTREKSLSDFSVDEKIQDLYLNMDKPEYQNNLTFRMFVEIVSKREVVKELRLRESS